ncbi:probable E3 ubiquitin-protein ligase TRIM8 [Mizuhopecten yessoensis]|uniref:probable E3 ubiquitin-protein ligase TRIM8 n=1 Tax=Mizuhopecten yessoensis TaxID=6573 RepID=UPI000B458CF4|nr:probable E3 ubiquitin-protein ligase TRIM8 [Mizuhopecten yessoensis]
MAEGGSSHEVSEISRPEMDSHLLDCPICLEKLHQPKSLPCLHSFCQECLSTFITNDISGNMASATAFPCPVCRKMTNPVNAAEDKDKWAQQFPANNLIKGLVKVAEREPMYCKPCRKKGNTRTPATIWCKTCNVLFCETCKLEYHDLFLDECETVDVTGKAGMVQRQLTKQVRCGKHTEKMDYYCEDHQILGCSRCIAIDHRRCDEVTTTQEYCDKLKRDLRLDDLNTSLKKTTEAIELLITEFGEQLQTLLEDQDTGLKSLADLRQQIDTRLDVMQKNITDELIANYKEEKYDLEMSMQKCERLMFSIQSTIESSGKAIQRNDSVDTILLYQRGQAEVKSYEDLVTEMRKNFTTVRIKHIVDPNLLTLDKDSPLSMGNIKMEKTPSRLPGPMSSPLSQCGVTEVSKFCIKCPSDDADCHAPGIVYLPNDHIVVGDYHNKKIKLFTASGKYEDEMKLQGKPYDMCRVDDHTVAVANYNAPIINVVKVESSKLTLLSEIKLSNSITPWGITTTGDEFTVSCREVLYNVQQNGNTQHIQTYPFQCYHLVSDPRTLHVYGSQWISMSGGVAVYRLSDGTGADIVTVGVLKNAFGVDVDVEGNVYVCGRESNNVVQMSEDGAHVRELLTSSDGVYSPRAISVCGDMFVVTNESSQNRNYVHVFKLNDQ